ncbi:hypothetical protein CDAR_82531 [Caerostris darwini]|uniref:Uncharacterized protein n=1 Tax=Caerostris darwini TaxID=1538125 RepID=A0AAV4UNA7_9ARAC|nr:hypothetical protein CDAR_82531 [Caerostris darwini]
MPSIPDMNCKLVSNVICDPKTWHNMQLAGRGSFSTPSHLGARLSTSIIAETCESDNTIALHGVRSVKPLKGVAGYLIWKRKIGDLLDYYEGDLDVIDRKLKKPVSGVRCCCSEKTDSRSWAVQQSKQLCQKRRKCIKFILGTTKYVQNSIAYFNFEKFTSSNYTIKAAGKEALKALGKGSIRVKALLRGKTDEIELKEVFYVLEFFKTAAYIFNKTGVPSEQSASPRKLWFRKKPRIRHMHIIGSLCYSHVPFQKRRKMDKKTIRGILIRHNGMKYTEYGYQNRKLLSPEMSFFIRKQNFVRGMPQSQSKEQKIE